MTTTAQLRHDALAIWQAGVDAVRADRLVERAMRRQGNRLSVGGEEFEIKRLNRIAVVGAGKGGAAMASAVESILGEAIVDEKVVGWVNVPDDCARPLLKIHLHGARPAGVNEPTEEGVRGSLRILEMVRQLSDDDLCLVLISGGGSALLPAPRPPLTLADKLAVTRFLMQSSATINELNTVRKRLSLTKGGGLARASHAGQMVSLIVSDVVKDPLDIIASGPTVPDRSTASEARAILQKFGAAPPVVPQAVFDFLDSPEIVAERHEAFPAHVHNHIIGNNETALTAAKQAAERLGFRVLSLGSENQGDADSQGRALAEQCCQLRDAGQADAKPLCILSGGEPVVHLPPTDQPRKGGRNQQLVLAALDALWDDGLRNVVMLSGGTDGEDGPTDAAGAWADAELLQIAKQKGLRARPFLEINNSYAFFDQVDGLIRTGPTQTNVMDLRVALIGNG